MARIDGRLLPLPVDIARDGDMLKIAIPPNTSLGDAVVWLVTYLDRADVTIENGENAGKSMVYTQVVTGRQVLGMWEGATGANLKLPLARSARRRQHRHCRHRAAGAVAACPALSWARPPTSAEPIKQEKPVPGGRDGSSSDWSTQMGRLAPGLQGLGARSARMPATGGNGCRLIRQSGAFREKL